MDKQWAKIEPHEAFEKPHPHDKMMLDCMVRDWEAKMKLKLQMKTYRYDFTRPGDNYEVASVCKQKQYEDYFDPESKHLDALLRLGNNLPLNKKIFEGENKTICAWVSCDDIRCGTTTSSPDTNAMTHYKYNPKKPTVVTTPTTTGTD